jgi:hypothetical protein
VKNGLEEGTITFWFGHEDPGWTTNMRSYVFGPFGTDSPGAEVGIIKETDGVLHFTIAVHGRTFRHARPVLTIRTGPSPDGVLTHGMFFTLTWSPTTVTLILGGRDPAKKVVAFRV